MEIKDKLLLPALYVPATGLRSVRGGGENTTDCLLIRTETSDPASPPVRGSGLQSTVVHLRLSGPATLTGNHRLQTNLYNSTDNLGTTDVTNVADPADTFSSEAGQQTEETGVRV